jgi:uncharacterized protein (TIGR02265 family)
VTEAIRYLGYHMSPGFLSSAAGRALLLLSGGSPRRLLSNVPMAYRASMDYGACRVEWRGRDRGVLLVEGNAIPHAYYEGSLWRTFEMTQMQGVTVNGRQVGLLDSEVEIAWG